MVQPVETCPITGCDGPVRRHQLMCPRHWYKVSLATRREVWDAYKEQPRSERHLAAVFDALDQAEEAA